MLIPHLPSRYRWVVLTALGALLVGAAPAAAEQVSNLAEKLSTLRGEVEGLSATLERKDTEIRDQLRALARQKTEFELELKKEQMLVKKLQHSISETKARVTEEQGRDAELKPLFESYLKDIRAYVQNSLPFRRSERLAELQKLEDLQRQGTLETSKALSRLWTFAEDEFRLTRESGLYKQPIQVDGEEHLAEVARLGMVLLYFRVDEQLVGQARKGNDGWVFERITDLEQRKLVLQLFDNFKKQIRVGLFQLPAAFDTPAAGNVTFAVKEQDEPASQPQPADVPEPQTSGSEPVATPLNSAELKPAPAKPAAVKPMKPAVEKRSAP